MSPALAGGFFTAEPPGEYSCTFFVLTNTDKWSSLIVLPVYTCNRMHLLPVTSSPLSACFVFFFNSLSIREIKNVFYFCFNFYFFSYQ